MSRGPSETSSVDLLAYERPSPAKALQILEGYGMDACLGRWPFLTANAISKIAEAGRDEQRAKAGIIVRTRRRTTTPEQEEAAIADVRNPERPELMLLAEARLAAGQAADAVPLLQTWVASHPKDGTAWQVLGRAYSSQGQQLRAIRADAEAQVAQLDYQAALDRLRAAQDLVRKGGPGADYIEASIIDTRARQVQSLLREQALER